MKSETTIKHLFESDDLDGCGQYLVKSNRAEIKDDGFLSTIMFKVGWTHNINSEQPYGLVAMSDGMCEFGYYKRPEGGKVEFIPFLSKQDLIDYLNRDGSYRMATKDEVVRVVSYQKYRWLEKLI